MARTTKQALEMIVSVRPPVFLTVINMEITRHNSLAISANTLNINLNNAIIVRAKDELLRILDLLINKHAQSVADLIVEVCQFREKPAPRYSFVTIMFSL